MLAAGLLCALVSCAVSAIFMVKKKNKIKKSLIFLRIYCSNQRGEAAMSATYPYMDNVHV